MAIPIVLGAVTGPASAAVMAFYFLALYGLARNNRAGWRSGLVITVAMLFGAAMIVLNHVFGPDWPGPGWGGGPDLTPAQGGVFLIAWLIAGVVAYLVYWRVGYLRWVRRWLAGKPKPPEPDAP